MSQIGKPTHDRNRCHRAQPGHHAQHRKRQRCHLHDSPFPPARTFKVHPYTQSSKADARASRATTVACVQCCCSPPFCRRLAPCWLRIPPPSPTHRCPPSPHAPRPCSTCPACSHSTGMPKPASSTSRSPTSTRTSSTPTPCPTAPAPTTSASTVARPQ